MSRWAQQESRWSAPPALASPKSGFVAAAPVGPVTPVTLAPLSPLAFPPLPLLPQQQLLHPWLPNPLQLQPAALAARAVRPSRRSLPFFWEQQQQQQEEEEAPMRMIPLTAVPWA